MSQLAIEIRSSSAIPGQTSIDIPAPQLERQKHLAKIEDVIRKRFANEPQKQEAHLNALRFYVEGNNRKPSVLNSLLYTAFSEVGIALGFYMRDSLILDPFGIEERLTNQYMCTTAMAACGLIGSAFAFCRRKRSNELRETMQGNIYILKQAISDVQSVLIKEEGELSESDENSLNSEMAALNGACSFAGSLLDTGKNE